MNKNRLSSLFIFHCSVRHAFSWKIVQNNVVVLIQDIIYPLLCISEDDIELFNDEPVEFVRARLGKHSSSSSSLHTFQFF